MFSNFQVSPHWRHTSQIGHDLSNCVNSIFDFFLCGFFGEREPQRTMRDLMGPSDGQQHMAGIKETGGTGRAGGCADSLVVQKQQERFALDPFKAEIHVSGEPFDRIAVQNGVRDLGKALDQLVAQRGHPLILGLHVFAGLFQGRRHSHNGRDIFSAGPFAPLLCAA